MLGDLPSGPVLKNPPSNGGEECLIPGWGIKIAHATGQLSWSSQLLRPRASTKEAHRLQRRPRMPQLRPNTSLINVFFLMSNNHFLNRQALIKGCLLGSLKIDYLSFLTLNQCR